MREVLDTTLRLAEEGTALRARCQETRTGTRAARAFAGED
jgi:hypothetical protein